MIYLVSAFVIIVIFLLVTVDIMFIPTSILSIAALLGFFIYLTYVYVKISPLFALYILIIFFTLAVIYVILMTKFKIWRKLSFTEKLPVQNDYQSGNALQEIVGVTGTTITELKPIGLILINNQRKDAIAVNGFIKKNQSVEVVGKSGEQLQVKPYKG